MNNDEKLRCNIVNNNILTNFQNNFNYCVLRDLGYIRSRYTLNNKQTNIYHIKEKIDRFCANSRWINLFPRFSNHYLTRYTYDHNLIQLELFSKYDCMPIDTNIYYIIRFEQSWRQDNESFDVVNATWNFNNDTSLSKSNRVLNNFHNW